MLKRSHLPTALALVAAIWLAAGCKPPPPPAAPPAPSGPKTVPGGPAAGTGSQGQDLTETAPVAAGVTETIKQHASLFPKGVKLETITVHDGVAALDFSPEFNQLANMGDTTESHAQKQLRAALAAFPAIQKMTVTVHGKPFDSQTTDWTTPFPVRLSAEEKDAGSEKGSAVEDTASGHGGGR